MERRQTTLQIEPIKRGLVRTRLAYAYTGEIIDFLDKNSGCTLIGSIRHLSAARPFYNYVRPNVATTWHRTGARLGLIGNPEENLKRGPSQYHYEPEEPESEVIFTIHWELAPFSLFVFLDEKGPHRGLPGPQESGNWLLSGYVI